jgi:phospholipid-translocating ATPase
VQNHGSQDLEMLERAEPPEAIAANTPTINNGIEYDDDDSMTEEQRERHFFGHETPQRPYWKKSMWEDVRVGDFVKIMDNESFTADILICGTPEDENVAYVETKDLDEETSHVAAYRSCVYAFTICDGLR